MHVVEHSCSSFPPCCLYYSRLLSIYNMLCTYSDLVLTTIYNFTCHFVKWVSRKLHSLHKDPLPTLIPLYETVDISCV